MSITKPLVLDETMQALNHLIAHQNAAIDILASDKRAELVTNVGEIAQLAKNDEILEVMDYGDEIHPEWIDGETHYNPAMNFCHVSDEELEDGEIIHGAFFEWDKTLPAGIPFDPEEAIYYFDGTEGAGNKYITISRNYNTGWVAGQSIQITLTEAPAENDQLFIDCGGNYENNPTAGRNWYVYAKGDTTAKQQGTTSNGTSGTKLGETDATSEHNTNGRVNAPSRVVSGYNRWSQSFLRQYLNSELISEWYQPQNPWDRPSASILSKPGFLAGYAEEARHYFKPIKVVTVTNNSDGNVDDVTYDRVFLSSLEQMYCVPQFAGKEGAYWEYYKRLLGRTTPAPTSQTYARLIKYGIKAPTTARYCFRRSAYRSHANNVWNVNSSGYVGVTSARSAFFCAPGVFISG